MTPRQKQIANQAKSFVDEYARTFGLDPETASTLKLWYTLGAQWADSHPPQDTSVIKWQTGEPKEEGDYLVVVHSKRVEFDRLYAYGDVKNGRIEKAYFWKESLARTITAWCKLSDIKPYKEG